MVNSIKACSICGSKNLNSTPGGLYSAFTAYGIAPLSGKILCTDCDKIVFPIEFKNENDYQKFIKTLNTEIKSQEIEKTESRAKNTIIAGSITNTADWKTTLVRAILFISIFVFVIIPVLALAAFVMSALSFPQLPKTVIAFIIAVLMLFYLYYRLFIN